MDEKADVKEGPWWVWYAVPDGQPRMAIGFVVANTEHYLTLTPDKDLVGNDVTIQTSSILSDGPCVCCTALFERPARL